MYAEQEIQSPPGPPPSHLKATASTKIVHDDVDRELLDEAGHSADAEHAEAVLEESDDRDLDKNLQWLKEAHRPHHQSYAPLELPILIPQTDPGIQNPFSRAWAPVLKSHDVDEVDFLHFIDHLNVCKAASPPFQVLNLAGNVLGFTPIPFAFAVSMGTQALATAGMVATSRVRITRYLQRVNHEYFVPRGLVARVTKQDTLSQITRQPADAPLMAPRNDDDSPHPHGLRERRLQAMNGYIAPLRFEELPSLNEERNMIDKLSSKMVARKAQKKESKMIKDYGKEKEKAAEEYQKLEKEAQKITAKAQKEMAKSPEKKQSIEAKMQEELAKLDKDGRKVDAKFHEKAGDGGKNEIKAASKFLWIAIGNLDHTAEVGAPAT